MEAVVACLPPTVCCRHYWLFMATIQNNINLMSHMRKLKPREVPQLPQCHTAGQQKSWDQNILSSVPDTELTPLLSQP